MLITLTLGSEIHDRYLVRQQIKQEEYFCTYLVEDQAHFNEVCLLTQLATTERDGASTIGKLLHPDLHALMQIKHPNVQQIKDYFWNSNQMFILQEYIDGKTYQEVLHARPHFTEPEALDLLHQLLPALQHLHQQNVTHGNILPQNIVLKNDDHRPVLINFGIIQTIQGYLKLGITESESSESTPVSTQFLSSDAAFVASGIRRDLHGLAVTILILSTGQPLENLFDQATETWNWERWVLLSDQLTLALTRMLMPKDDYCSADEILRILRSSLPVRMSNTLSQSALPSVQSNLTSEIAFPSVAEVEEAPSSGDLKRAVTIGSIVGVSILIGAVILRTQIPGSFVSTSQPQSTNQTSQAPTPPLAQPTTTPTDVSSPPPSPISQPSAQISPPQALPEPEASSAPSLPIQPQPPMQKADETNATIIGDASSKNIRSGPGTNYPVKHIAYPGDRIRVIEKSQDSGGYTWYKVYFPKSGAEGWLAGQLVNFD